MEKKRLFILVMIVAVATVSACAQVMNNQAGYFDMACFDERPTDTSQVSVTKDQKTDKRDKLFDVGVNNSVALRADNNLDQKLYDVESYLVGNDTVPYRWAGKYGNVVFGSLGYKVADYSAMSSPMLGAGWGLYFRYFNFRVSGALSSASYNRFAEQDLKNKRYLTYVINTSVGVKPFILDSFDQHQLFLTAGCCWEGFNTGSVVAPSFGNKADPVFGLEYLFREFAEKHSWGFRLEYIPSISVVQNKGSIAFKQVLATFSFVLGLGRNETNLL